MNEEILWSKLRMPLAGRLLDELENKYCQIQQPWRAHALLCLREQRFSPTQTHLVLGLKPEAGIACSAWLSLPDLRLCHFLPLGAFLFHVSVEETFRGKGLGSQLVRVVAQAAADYGANRLYLATGSQELKRRFYGPLGFRSVPGDDYLMILYLSGQAQQNRLPLPNACSNGYFRATSVHDLATYQSIRGLDHWSVTKQGVERKCPVECEEEFCYYYSQKAPPDQYICAVIANGSWFVSWLGDIAEDCYQFIVSNVSSDIEIRMHAEAAREVAKTRVQER